MKVKVITEIKGIFNTLFSTFKIMHLQSTQAYWTGNFYLESLFKTRLAMIIQKYRLMPEEFSYSSLLCTPQERAEELTRVFRILIPDLRIDYVESTLVAWIGNFHLKDFIENFFRLKTKDLQAYTYLKDNYKKELKILKMFLVK